MKIKILNLWYYVRSSFWFLPGLMAAMAIALSFVTIGIDWTFADQAGARHWWVYSGGAVGARTILSTITSSMITVAGVVFSITIVVLSQASSQFGPRLIRNFMNIKANQMVLGTFVATFMYGILILGAIRATSGDRFVPGFSVSVCIVMAFLSLGLMIYFIHNISETIQVQNIIARVHRDLDSAVERIFPQIDERGNEPVPDSVNRNYDIPTTCDREACPVMAAKSGYLQAIDEDALVELAVRENLLIHLGYRPGNFITRGSTLITVWPGEKVDDSLAKAANDIFVVGPERTLEQDAEFAIGQMVEIAVRALSPGVNDPITAMTCIDWLGDSLCKLAGRKMPSSHRFDQCSRLRLIRKYFVYEGMVDAAFNMIRQNSVSVPAVSIHLLETIATIAGQTHRKKDRQALKRQAVMVANGCKDRLSQADDRHDLEKRYEAALKKIDSPPLQAVA
jgi:uncharacterized membrane protein